MPPLPRRTRISQAPPRPPLRAIATATVTATAALGALVALGALCGKPLLIPPLAASMALIAGAPALPLSQPRSVIGGQALSALVGVAIGAVSHSLWAGALAGGLALGAMLLTRTAHSPAAATAVIGAMSTGSPGAFVACTAAAATVLVGVGLLGSALRGPAYPRYWW